MKLADAVAAAYQRKWSMSNNFTVQIDLVGSEIQAVGQFEEDINLSIVSIKTPDITNAGIEGFIANGWRVHNGRDNLYRFSLTFRDYDQMILYSKFHSMYQITKKYYFDEVTLDFTLYKDGDWHGEQPIPVAAFRESIIDGISNLDFSNTTDAQVAEFTVDFKCIDPVFG